MILKRIRSARSFVIILAILSNLWGLFYLLSSTWTHQSLMVDVGMDNSNNIILDRTNTHLNAFNNLSDTTNEDIFELAAQKFKTGSFKIHGLQAGPANKISLQVFAWRRVASLQRLLRSLQSAEYSSIKQPVDLIFYLDGGYSETVEVLVESFPWKHGTKSVHKSQQHSGLKKMMLYAWQPKLDDDISLFLEDDIEMSPLYFKYLSWCIKTFLPPQASSNNIIGCSLYTPRVDEISPTIDPAHPPTWKPSQLLGDNQSIFLHQLPCSWGGTYIGKHWNGFVKYFQDRIDMEQANQSLPPVIPDARSNAWKQSWKRYLVDYMVMHDLYMVYPSFPNETSFSTNHYEEGVHTVVPTSDSDEEDLQKSARDKSTADVLRSVIDERFTVPLFARSDSKHVFDQLKLFQPPFQINNNVNDNIYNITSRIPRFNVFGQRLATAANSSTCLSNSPPIKQESEIEDTQELEFQSTKSRDHRNKNFKKMTSHVQTRKSTAASKISDENAPTYHEKPTLAKALKTAGGIPKQQPARKERTALQAITQTHNQPPAKIVKPTRPTAKAATTKKIIPPPTAQPVNRPKRAAAASKSDDTVAVEVVQVVIPEKAVVEEPKRRPRTRLAAASEASQNAGSSNNEATVEPVVEPVRIPVIKRPGQKLQEIMPEPVEPESDHDDLDQQEEGDPMMVAEYAKEIFAYMKNLEIATRPDPDYMDCQKELRWDMRTALVDWMIEVHLKFKLLPETLFLAINIMDRFLSLRVVGVSKLQLVGIVALFLASKYEEIIAPSIKNFVFMADNGFTEEEVIRAERFVLGQLGFSIKYPNPLSFLRRSSKADQYDLQVRTLAKYLMEAVLLDHAFVGILPSMLAAASHYLSRKMLQRGPWDKNLAYYSGYKESEIMPVVILMTRFLSRPREFDTIYKKYASKRYMKASIYVEDWISQEMQDSGDSDF